MFKINIKTAWRSLLKNKFYSAINIFGLAVGLATGILLLLWVQNELSFDRFNKKYPDIYQLSAHFVDNGTDKTWGGVPGPLSVYAKSIPQVLAAVRIHSEFDQDISNKESNRIFGGNNMAFVDSGFFSLFNYRFLEGSPETAFPNYHSILLTRTTAAKLFGGDAGGYHAASAK